MHNRQNALTKWLGQTLMSTQFSLTPLAGDASFRRYFRLHYCSITRIVMDAPPDRESIEPFLAVANLLSDAGVHTPKIHGVDIKQGFAILDDFGDTLLLNKLRTSKPSSVLRAPSPRIRGEGEKERILWEKADTLYTAAMDTLVAIQCCLAPETKQLPFFNKEYMLYELNVFKEWFLLAYLKLQLTSKEEILLQEIFDWLCTEMMRQPQVVIHRDYHSRNIMVLSNGCKIDLGIIDFQDAMFGPLTYDLASLLKDCYIQWPRENVLGWLTYFYNKTSLAQQRPLSTFIRDFDWCGLQRHLKVLGVFSRLYLRDNKPNYLQDLPLTLHYVMACLESYEETQPFYQFMQNRICLP